MSKLCNNCGNQNRDDAKFCMICGSDFQIDSPSAEKDQTESKIKMEETQADNEYMFQDNSYSTELVEEPKKKKRSLHLETVIPALVAVLIVLGIVLGIMYLINPGIVTTNDDGDKVFKFTAEEFIEDYNDANSDKISKPLDFSDFEHDINSNDKNLYMTNIGDGYMVLFTDGPGYDSNITDIKYWESGANEDIPKEVICGIRGIYPNLSYEEAKEIAEETKTYFSNYGNDYRNITVSYNVDDDDTSWFISPRY